MNLRTLLLIVFFLALVGCSFKMHYAPMEKPGVDQMQALRDSHECKLEASNYRAGLTGSAGSVGVLPSNGVGVIGPGPGRRMAREATEQAEEFYIECMQLRGYQSVKK